MQEQIIDNEKILSVCRFFNIEGELTETKIFTDGHINSTYYAEFLQNGETKKYLVQNINIHVFKNQEILMENIVSVSKFLIEKIAQTGGDPKREALNFLKTKDGKYYFAKDDCCWRIYDFIDRAYTYNLIDNKDVFESAGRSFGRFQCLLNEYPSESLKETIPDFHNTPKRIEALKNAAKEDKVNRLEKVDAELKFALSRKDRAKIALDLLESGKIPLRVTHNDTKINNILFDEETKKGICIIDLDTIMPGLSLYDFGDAIRSGASTALEDEKDLSKVSVSLELYESYTKGYLSCCADALTKAEVEHLAYGAWLMTFECGVRFLTDYLDGDNYFKTNYPEHNLVRAKNQFAMVSDIERKMDKMNEITLRLYEEALKNK